MIPQSVSQGKHISSFCIINLILITTESQWTNRFFKYIIEMIFYQIKTFSEEKSCVMKEVSESRNITSFEAIES